MTTPAASISHAIRTAHEAGRTALVAFVTAGFPDKHRFAETLLTQRFMLIFLSLISYLLE